MVGLTALECAAPVFVAAAPSFKIFSVKLAQACGRAATLLLRCLCEIEVWTLAYEE